MDAGHVHCFQLTTYLFEIMQDSKHRAITQTIHRNLMSWVCSVTQANKLFALGVKVSNKTREQNFSLHVIMYTSKQNWNFRPKGEGRSGRRPLLLKRNLTF